MRIIYLSVSRNCPHLLRLTINYDPHLDKHLYLASNTAKVDKAQRTDFLPKRISAPGKGRSLNDNTMGSLKKGGIRSDQVAIGSENMNFHQLTCTIENLARFFKISTNSQGLERLVTQLYRIKDKLDRGWIEILDLRTALVVFYNTQYRFRVSNRGQVDPPSGYITIIIIMILVGTSLINILDPVEQV